MAACKQKRIKSLKVLTVGDWLCKSLWYISKRDICDLSCEKGPCRNCKKYPPWSACHLISISAAKLNLEGAKLRWRGRFRKKNEEWCDFLHSRVFDSTNFVFFFFRNFLSTLSSVFYWWGMNTTRKYRCSECRTCRTPVYAHARSLTTIELFPYWQIFCALSDDST